jgi:hypothetical protein
MHSGGTDNGGSLLFRSVLVLVRASGRVRTRLAACSIRIPLCQAKLFACCMSQHKTHARTPFHLIIKKNSFHTTPPSLSQPLPFSASVRAVPSRLSLLSLSAEITEIILGLARACIRATLRGEKPRRERERKEKDPPHPPLMDHYLRGAPGPGNQRPGYPKTNVQPFSCFLSHGAKRACA